MGEVFKEIDRDNSGYMGGDEMEFFLSDDSLNMYLEAIDVFPNDARSLFRLLDVDGSGDVSVEEFCAGCLRLKGEAKSFDIHCMIFNSERAHQRLEVIMEHVVDVVETFNSNFSASSLRSPFGKALKAGKEAHSEVNG